MMLCTAGSSLRQAQSAPRCVQCGDVSAAAPRLPPRRHLRATSHSSATAAVVRHSFSRPLHRAAQPRASRCRMSLLDGVDSATQPLTSASSALAAAASSPQMVASVGSSVENGVVALYLGGVLLFLGAGSFFVVRQVLIRRELENAAKDLQERVRLGEATPDEYFELGAIMLRKKFYSQALKNLMMAEEIWDGDPEELAQVHNATGFTLLQMEKFTEAEERFRLAVGLQPGYVTAWNNLGNSFETRRMWQEALEAYEESLSYDPSNQIALERKQMVTDKLDMLKY